MYIHNYQIHNVLDVYRQQLTRRSGAGGRHGVPPAARDQNAPQLETHPRQTIIERVAADIVDRIVRDERPPSFAGHLARTYEAAAMQPPHKRQARFTYTAIDENNCKITNTVPIDKLNALLGSVEYTTPTPPEGAGGSDTGT